MSLGYHVVVVYATGSTISERVVQSETKLTSELDIPKQKRAIARFMHPNPAYWLYGSLPTKLPGNASPVHEHIERDFLIIVVLKHNLKYLSKRMKVSQAQCS